MAAAAWTLLDTFYAGIKEISCVNRVRLFRTNELFVDSERDDGRDIVALVIKNDITVSLFPRRDEIQDLSRSQLARVFRTMKRHGFPDYEPWFLYDGVLPENAIPPNEDGDQVVSRATWKDVVSVDRDLFHQNNKFGESILQMLDKHVLHPHCQPNLGKQVTAQTRRQFPLLFEDQNTQNTDYRYVLMLEIYRYRELKFGWLYHHIDDPFCGLPSDPSVEKVSIKTYDRNWESPDCPFREYDQSCILVTESDQLIDQYVPVDNWGIVGYIRARFLSLYASRSLNECDVTDFLNARFNGDTNASFPRGMMAKAEVPFFVDVDPVVPYPPPNVEYQCTKCNLIVLPANESAEVNMNNNNIEIYHSKCWATHIFNVLDLRPAFVFNGVESEDFGSSDTEGSGGSSGTEGSGSDGSCTDFEGSGIGDAEGIEQDHHI